MNYRSYMNSIRVTDDTINVSRFNSFSMTVKRDYIGKKMNQRDFKKMVKTAIWCLDGDRDLICQFFIELYLILQHATDTNKHAVKNMAYIVKTAEKYKTFDEED